MITKKIEGKGVKSEDLTVSQHRAVAHPSHGELKTPQVIKNETTSAGVSLDMGSGGADKSDDEFEKY